MPRTIVKKGTEARKSSILVGDTGIGMLPLHGLCTSLMDAPWVNALTPAK